MKPIYPTMRGWLLVRDANGLPRFDDPARAEWGMKLGLTMSDILELPMGTIRELGLVEVRMALERAEQGADLTTIKMALEEVWDKKASCWTWRSTEERETTK